MPSRKRGVIYYGDVLRGKKTYEEYIANCYERNRENDSCRFPKCSVCPKTERKKVEKKTPKKKKV